MSSERIQRRIERLLDQIESEADQRNWQTVLDLANEILGFSPDDGDASAFLGVAQERLSATGGTGTTATSLPPEPSASEAVPKSGQPASFAAGRYQVKRFLGEGGKKKVYLAHDTLLDREVAFALIKTEGLDEAGRSRIQREAQAMGRLGSHPHIVTVFDLGQEQDQPYMVTELMGGGDVEGLIGTSEGHRLPLAQAISIAVETCRGLEFAHDRGIVHRDLKPGNVWLASDGAAKIGDFGLAVALDRSRLTTEGMMVGTVSYMPPEQAMGGEVSPRSDLYSLGALLYEMVTGRPPFLGDDSVSIIGQHINTPPVAPTWHNSECPRALDALILRLLAKDPSERPESASDVLSALEAIDLEIDVGARHAVPLQDDAHALDSVAGGIFVGRQREMGDLKACLEDALSGRGRMVTLVGEPGIGKTRTAQELATYAGLRGAQVLWGRSYEEQGVPPYWPWVQAIRSYVRERDPEQLRSEMGPGAADIAEVVSDVRERLPGLQPAPQLAPEQARFRLFDSIAAFFKTASQRQPLVLVLDDLHWADQPSLLLLQFVARELGGTRLLLIGTYRDMELSRQHPLAEALGELTRERLFQRVLLRGLTQEDVGRFIEMTSGNNPPIGLADAVHSQTEGNPLFVTEIVRLLVQEGELGADKVRETDSWTVRIPEGVREVIGRRLNRLSQRCNEALTVASILGREFTMAQLRPLVEEVTEDRLFEVLEEALAARVIEELPQAVGHYQFTHALIQETLAEELSLTRRVRLHGRIAEALERLYGDDTEAHAAELAHHFAQAEAMAGPEKLVRYSLQAGERALAAYAYEEAQGHFQRGLAGKGGSAGDQGPAPDAESAALLFGLGRTQVATFETHRLQEAVATLSRAFDYYAGAGDVERAVAVAEHPLQTSAGRVSVAGPLIAQALELVSPDSLQSAGLMSSYGKIVGLEEADYHKARELFERSLQIAQQEVQPGVELATLIAAAEVDAYHAQWEECQSKARRGVELASVVDDPLGEMLAHYWITLPGLVLGNMEGLTQHVEAMLPPAERMRHHFYLARAYFGNEIFAHTSGDLEAARVFCERGLAISPREGRLLFDLAMINYELGDSQQGEVHLGRTVELMRSAIPGPTIENTVAPYAIANIARTVGVADQLEMAKEIAETNLAYPVITPLIEEINRVCLSLIAVYQDDRAAAAVQHHALASNPHRGVTAIFGINADHVLGLLAGTKGDLDLAISHFEDAISISRSHGHPCNLAWTCCDYADALRDRNGPGDPAKAMSLLDESLAISSELGMRPLMERVLFRREILGA